MDGEEKVKLGKISAATFGFGGYQSAEIGLGINFSMKGAGCYKFVSGGWSTPPSEIAKWTLDDQTKRFGECMREVVEILNQAKVDNVAGLIGVPVELTFHNFNELKSWRVLEEVL